MKVRIKEKNLPRYQGMNSQVGSEYISPYILPTGMTYDEIDEQNRSKFFKENPMPAVQRYTPGQAAMNAGIGPTRRQEDIDAANWYNSSKQNQFNYDNSLYEYHLSNPNSRDSRKYINWYNRKYEDDGSDLWNGLFQFKMGVNALDNATNFLNNRRKMREDKRRFILDGLDPTPNLPMSGSRGDYTVNEGFFRPDEMQPPNKGQYTNPFFPTGKIAEYGGSIDNEDIPTTMRIRITGRTMEYGGQKGYGLDLNQRDTYTDMPDDPAENLSSTITEKKVPEDEFKLEAEHGETIKKPDKTFGEFKGKYHSEGGVKTTEEQTPEGSYIYSRVLKENRPEVLSALGLKPSRKGISYADLSRPYNTNKFVATIRSKNADPLRKKTAQMMLDKYDDKLGLIALAQESAKGFPDGIPDVSSHLIPYAAEGGELQKFQGVVGPSQVEIYDKEILDDLRKLQQLNNNSAITVSARRSKGDNTAPGIQTRQSIGLYGDIIPSELDEFAARHQWYFADKPDWDPRNKSDVEDFQREYNKRYNRFLNRDYFSNKRRISAIDGKFGEYTFNAPSLDIPENPTVATYNLKYRCGPNGVEALSPDHPIMKLPQSQQLGLYDTAEEAEKNCQKPKPPKKDVVPPDQYIPPKVNQPPFDYMLPDKIRMVSARMFPPEYIGPYYPDTTLAQPIPVFEDWRAKAAANQAMYNTAARTAGAYGPAQSLASNLAFMAGQQGDRLIQDIASTETRNVGIANPFAMAQAEIMNKQAELDAGNDVKRYIGNATARQNYRNAQRMRRKEIDTVDIAGWKNRSKLHMINNTNPYYYMDPFTGATVFKSGMGIDKLMNNYTNSGASMDSNLSKFPEYYNMAIGMNLPEDLAKRWAYARVTGGSSAPRTNPYALLQQQQANYGPTLQAADYYDEE